MTPSEDHESLFNKLPTSIIAVAGTLLAGTLVAGLAEIIHQEFAIGEIKSELTSHEDRDKELSDKIEKFRDVQVTVLAANSTQSALIEQLKEAIIQGRTERLAAQAELLRKIETLIASMEEIRTRLTRLEKGN